MTPKVPQGPESGLVPAHPEDPLDLDFAALVEPSRAAASPPPAPTAEDEENALIGAKSLGAEGFHVLLTRSRQTQAPNKVVLVIDDDAPTAELAARVLRKAGYQALVA
jgi:CheY-like chemotaxis protein